MPTAMVSINAPVEAFSSVAVPSASFVSQTWVLSTETDPGLVPTVMVRKRAPLEALSSLTESLPLFVTQT